MIALASARVIGRVMGNSKVGSQEAAGSSAALTAPASTMRAISAALKPSSARTSRLCSPSRSEEHPSELQSLMRISYAVLCLKQQSSITHTQKSPTAPQRHWLTKYYHSTETT